MDFDISVETLEAVENLLVPNDKIRVFAGGMCFEAEPLVPLTQTTLPEDLNSDPSLLIFFNYLLRLKPLMSFESLSNVLIGEIRRSYRVEQEYSRQDLLANILSALTFEQVTNLAISGIGICSLEEDECCWAIKEMESFIMEIEDCEYGGRWKFPPCTLGIPLYSPTEPELTVYILRPRNYVHPFLVDAGAICMGSFSESQSLERIAQLPDLCSKLIHLFSYAEQILVSGYRLEWDVGPAINILEPIFRKYRI